MSGNLSKYVSELGFESTYSDSRSHAPTHQENTSLNTVHATFYGRTKVNYSNRGMVDREAFGENRTSELGLEGRARFHFERGRVEKGI